MTEQPQHAQHALMASSAITPASARWKAALGTFVATLESANTRVTYTGGVRAFFTTPGAPDLGDITLAHLDAWRGRLIWLTSRECPPAERRATNTANLRLAALRSFLLFCRHRRWLSSELAHEDIRYALRALRGRVERPYMVLDEDGEREALLTAASSLDYEPARALALLALGLGAGLRVAELCALTVGDVAHDRTSAYVQVREGKGRKDRVVPIDESVYALVAAYVAASERSFGRSVDRDTPLFLSYQRARPRVDGTPAGQLTTQQARRIVARCVRVAAREGASTLAAKSITPHALRHDYALRVLQGDAGEGRAAASVAEVADLLGHASVATTNRYIRHTQRGRLAALAPRINVAGRTSVGEDSASA